MARSTALVTVGALALGLVGYGVADAYDRVPGILTIDEDTSGSATSTSAPASSGASPAPSAAAAGPSPAVSPSLLPALADAAPVPSPAALAKALAGPAADPALGPSVGVSVRDALTGTTLFEKDAAKPRTPASTMKVLTAAAIIEPLGADTRFRTSVVQGSEPGRLSLVAGGDMLLSTGASNPSVVEGHAGLATLAGQVATALRAQKVSKVSVSLDATYAAGPDFAPTWDRRDLDPGYVGKVAMLGLASDLVEHAHPAQLDPSGAALQAFVKVLAAQGIQASVAPAAKAPAGARTLGAVESAPAADVLAVALARSDNALTEGLARQAAIRAGVPLGKDPFAATAAWVRTRLQGLGYDITGLKNLDTCGLARGQVAPARLVSDVLVRGASGKDPALQSVLAELPVAGLSGTLFDRFDTTGATAAAGVARAKTGTLTGVSAMAGTVVDRSGRLLTYEIVADQVPATGTDSARMALDRLISVLAGCGCR